MFKFLYNTAYQAFKTKMREMNKTHSTSHALSHTARNEYGQHNQSNREGQRGTSLIELLVGISIFAILTSVATTILFNLIQTQTKNNVATDTYSTAQDIMSDLASTIRSARLIEEELTTEEQLAVRNNENDTVIFSLEEGTIFLRVGTDDEQPLALNGPSVLVTDLRFRVTENPSLGPPAVTIFLGLESQGNSTGKPALRAELDLTTTVSLRSY